jgi:hypothetical protein
VCDYKGGDTAGETGHLITSQHRLYQKVARETDNYQGPSEDNSCIGQAYFKFHLHGEIAHLVGQYWLSYCLVQRKNKNPDPALGDAQDRGLF